MRRTQKKQTGIKSPSRSRSYSRIAKGTAVFAAAFLAGTAFPIAAIPHNGSAHTAYAETGNGHVNPDVAAHIVEALDYDILRADDPAVRADGSEASPSVSVAAIGIDPVAEYARTSYERATEYTSLSDFGELRDTGHSLYVKQTLVDKAEVGATEGLAELFMQGDDHVGRALFAQYSMSVPVYDPGAEFSRYVAFADPGTMNSTFEVRDWDAGQLDLSGTLIDEIDYDMETGIAYIPKSLYARPGGAEYDRALQLQLMCIYDFNTAAPQVDITIENNSSRVTAVAQKSHLSVVPLDMAMEIPIVEPETAEQISLSDLSVEVNGEPYTIITGTDADDTASYDPSRGVLSLAVKTSQVVSVKVTINERSPLDTLDKAYGAIKASSMNCLKEWGGKKDAVLNHLDLSKVKVGAQYSYSAVLWYTSENTDNWKKKLAKNLFAYTYVRGDGAIAKYVHKLSDESAASTVISGLRHPNASGMGDDYDLMNEAFDWPDRQRDLSYVPTTSQTPNQKSGSDRYTLGGLDWRGWPQTTESDNKDPYYRGALQCAHIGTLASGKMKFQGSHWYGTVYMRVLAVGNDYVVCGFSSPTCNTQTGSAAYKIKVQSKGTALLKKVSANPTKTVNTSYYSLENAKYGVYKTKSDAKKNINKIAVLKTDKKGNTNKVELDAGTYYVKEYKASKGFRLDPNTYKCVVKAGQTTQVDSKEEPDVVFVKVKKQPKGSTAFTAWSPYTLAGAVYEVRDENKKVVATLTTDTNGDTPLSGELPLGIYTVKEKTASPGYKLDPNEYTVKVTKDNKVATVYSGEEPIVAVFPFKLTKRDYNRMNTNTGNAPQGGATLKATYSIKYYDGYYDALAAVQSQTPKWTKIMTASYNGMEASIKPSAAQMYFTGSQYGWPLGTYLVKESISGEGYLVNPSSYLIKITQDMSGSTYLGTASSRVIVGKTTADKTAPLSETNTLLQDENVCRGHFRLSKFIETTVVDSEITEGKQGAPGVKFDIINNNPQSVQNTATGAWVKRGDVLYTITTDEFGYADTLGIENKVDIDPKGVLAYGSYIIHEHPETVPNGYKHMKDFTIMVSKNGYTINKVIENMMGTTVRSHKIDKGTNKTIKGTAKFQILDEKKNPVAFQVIYPSDTTTTVLESDADGYLVFPQKLPPGKFYLKEIEAPYGYLYSKDLIPFTCDGTTVTMGDEKPMNVNIGDDPAMGVIYVEKRDSETGNTITKSQAVYEIYALEDIVTEDGTVRATKDQLVDTVTCKNGIGESKQLYLGHYYVVEKIAPYGYLVNTEPMEVPLEYKDDRTPVVSKRVVQYDDPAKFGIRLIKKDKVSGRTIPVEGAEFTVRATEDIVGGDGYVWFKAGDEVGQLTTDSEGYAETKMNLRVGKYEAIENSAPTGYIAELDPVPFEIPYVDQDTTDEFVEVEFFDDRMYVDFEFVKKDSETGETVPLPNTVIDIYADDDIVMPEGSVVFHKDELVERVSTDATGIARSAVDIPIGSYYAKEISAPAGYLLDSDTVYKLDVPYPDDPKQQVVLFKGTIYDEPAKGRITFLKIDAETGRNITVPNVHANVYADEDIYTPDGTLRTPKDTLVAEFITDHGNFCESRDLYLGKYRVEEVEAPEGYTISDKPEYVELVYENQMVPIVHKETRIADDDVYGTIFVQKMDRETGKPVLMSGIQFEIRASKDIITGDGTVRYKAGELIEQLVTDDTGAAYSQPCYLGEYTVTEIRAPKGYVLDSTSKTVVLEYGGQNKEVVSAGSTVENDLQKGIISVTKTDAESGLPILTAGAVFEIVALEDIVPGDGTRRVEAGEVVDTIVTDDTGIANSKELYLGKYSVSEKAAPKGYLLSEEVKEVELSYGNQTEPLVYEMTGLADISVKGTISIHKEDSDLDEPLEDVEYEIRAPEDVIGGDGRILYKKDEVIETLVTDKDGNATSKELPLGRYTITETKQPNGYELDPSSYPVTLRYADEHTALVHTDRTLYNTPTNINIRKVSTADLDQPLSGVQFVGWEKKNERTSIDALFGVYAEDGYDVKLAEVDYYGPITVVPDGEKIEKSFVLSKVPVESGYALWTSQEELSQGKYVLHLSYTDPSGDEQRTAITFTVNEYDKNAYFALGSDFIDPTSQMANDFKRSDLIDSAGRPVEPALPMESTGNIDSTAPENGSDQANTGNTVADDMGHVEDLGTSTPALPDGTDPITGTVPDLSVTVDLFSEPAAAPIESDTAEVESTDRVEVIDDNETPQASGEEIVSAITDAISNITSESADEEDKMPPAKAEILKMDVYTPLPAISDVPVYRVPVVLAEGEFVYNMTNSDGTCQFKHVPQGEIGIAEFSAAKGYNYDMTPGYATISDKGVVSARSANGNTFVADTVYAEGSKATPLDFVFADNPIKLYISKKDVTNDEELPGNVMSVYEAPTDIEKAEGKEVGELIETWTSTEKPHLMELLPAGKYILKEETPVEGYTVAESIEFELSQTGVAQQVTMYNSHDQEVADELIEAPNPLTTVQKVITQTGDSFPVLVFLFYSILALVIAFIYSRIQRRRRNK